MATAIVRDTAEAARCEEEHLVLPRIGTQRPTMTEDNGLARAPILEIDPRVVLRREPAHSRAPFSRTCCSTGEHGVGQRWGGDLLRKRVVSVAPAQTHVEIDRGAVDSAKGTDDYGRRNAAVQEPGAPPPLLARSDSSALQVSRRAPDLWSKSCRRSAGTTRSASLRTPACTWTRLSSMQPSAYWTLPPRLVEE